MGTDGLLEEASIADALVLRSTGPAWSGSTTQAEIRFGTGFMINGIPFRPLLSDRSFGHDGATGSLGFADADAEIGFGYINNFGVGSGDERANRLVRALQDCLGM